MENLNPIFDYSKLEGKIKEKYKTQKIVTNHLSFGNTSLSQKLNNRVAFSQKDILELASVLDIDDAEIPEYFFKLKVRFSERDKQTS